MAGVTDELEVVIAPVCAAADVELVDVELRQGTLQVTVEREGGLDLDAIAEVARSISEMLDEHGELVPVAPFELEVSSPGLERRLRRPSHFRRVLGETIALRTLPGTPGERRSEGELIAADDEGIVLRQGDGATRHLSYQAIERAHTVFDWRAALRGGSRPADSEIDTEPAVEEDLDETIDSALELRAAQSVAAGRGDQSKKRESR